MYDGNDDDASKTIHSLWNKRNAFKGNTGTIDPDYLQWLKANPPESSLLDDQAGVANSSNRTCDMTHTSDQEQGDLYIKMGWKLVKSE